MMLLAVVNWEEEVTLIADNIDSMASMFMSLRDIWQQALQQTSNGDGNSRLPSVKFKVGCLDSQAFKLVMEGMESIATTGMIRKIIFDGSIMNSHVSRQQLDRLFNLVTNIKSLKKLQWNEGSMAPLTMMLRCARNIESVTYLCDQFGVKQDEVLHFADALSGHPALTNVSFLGPMQSNVPGSTLINVNPVFKALSTLPLLKEAFVLYDNIDSSHSGPSSFLGVCDKPGLTTLALSLHRKDFASFYNGLMRCNNILDLMLMTPIKAEHCRFLSELIRCNRVLRSLYVGISTVEEEQLVNEIIDALGRNSTMRSISFTFQNDKDMFGAEVQDAFVSMMRNRNFSLTDVVFTSAFQSGDESYKNKYSDFLLKMSFYSKLNMMGRKILLSDLGGGTKGLLADFLILNHDVLDVTFYYLSMAPDLIY